MSRTAGRSKEQTRRIVLDAAGEVFRQRGLHATLDDVAQQAGLSKGGLIYHFASKDNLVLAVATDLLQKFVDLVEGHVHTDDTQPGRFTRAYLRATLTAAGDERSEREEFLLIAQLLNNPAVAVKAQEADQRLKAALANDGLPERITALVTSAADGVETSALWGGSVDVATRNQLLDDLLAITYNPAVWSALS